MSTPNIASPADEALTEAARDRFAMALLADGLQSREPASPALHARLQSRVARSAAAHRSFRTVRQADLQWRQLGKGVRASVLYDDGEVSSAFVEFEPGTSLPGHRHFADEECMVLRGSLSTGELVVGAHGYHLAPSGSKHPNIGTDEGALIFLRGTSIGRPLKIVRELVSAWLPGRGISPITVHANEDGWIEAGDGARIKPLRIHGGSASLLVSLEAGGRLPGYTTAQTEECLTLSGDIFLGDILLRSGEYQQAPRTVARGAITSDVGGLLFLHTSAQFPALNAKARAGRNAQLPGR